MACPRPDVKGHLPHGGEIHHLQSLEKPEAYALGCRKAANRIFLQNNVLPQLEAWINRKPVRAFLKGPISKPGAAYLVRIFLAFTC